jgi:hypothetical protein
MVLELISLSDSVWTVLDAYGTPVAACALMGKAMVMARKLGHKRIRNSATKMVLEVA